ncbi:uncharacterized zinc finger protein CG2678 isoform X2 [Drosophila biarmipes]|nr:uncharacterized zinc finger protein CG2678 isoform X2 [Drosophila biarmipes]
MDDTATLVDLFAEIRDPTFDQPEMRLSHILAQCTNRPVERDDLLPQYICLSCVLAAQNAFRFMWKCERSYQSHCSKAFMRNDPLKTHLQTRDYEGPLSCSECSAVFIEGIHLEIHRREHLPKEGSLQSDSTEELDSEESDRKKDVKPNWAEYSTKGRTKEPPVPKPMDFKACDLSKENLEIHNILKPQVLRHEEPLNHGCSPASNTSEDADVKKKWFRGDSCSNTDQKSRKKRAKKPKCEICRRTFCSNSSLKRHMLTHNHDTEPLKCSYCTEEFRSENLLKRHERGHSGDLFRCQFCSLAFLDTKSLRQHQKRIHGNRLGSTEEKSASKRMASRLAVRKQSMKKEV